ncbi:MAG: hypothetical protein A3J83_03665 [Elusimicrobia bacterium RIFOXYA2_FULL_40_6]|nr:MAG: hypothetical protein A3J83_03665 [Elusimicrobia bacterium RIFOXYA2_FULL_40_6]
MKKTLILTVIVLLIGMSECKSHDFVAPTRIEKPVESKMVTEYVKDQLRYVEENKNDIQSIEKLYHSINHWWNLGVYVSSETTRTITRALIKVFYNIENLPKSEANKNYIINIIGRYDNSLEAKGFILKLITGRKEKYKEEALRSISQHGVHGEDVYYKLKDFIKKGIITRTETMTALRRANPEKALKDLQEIAATTKDVKEFVWVGQTICDYHNPELIDILLMRIGEFKRSGDFEPTLAIDHKLLDKYIQNAKGNKLKMALLVKEMH